MVEQQQRRRLAAAASPPPRRRLATAAAASGCSGHLIHGAHCAARHHVISQQAFTFVHLFHVVVLSHLAHRDEILFKLTIKPGPFSDLMSVEEFSLLCSTDCGRRQSWRHARGEADN
ncbi:hypothetical protein EYF80_040650 [Liparis tanakae]|uniref:Uncharacterized protein n=1 Tax=Liparis tanakae TaxID=230148 RepID=A0A4Z2G9E5_9TELE|nr:hypothetical protein EYF80_040650 [Liparis tanakae]